MSECHIQMQQFFGGWKRSQLQPRQMVGHLSICWPRIIWAALASPSLVICAASHRNYLHRSYAAWPGKCMKIVTYIRGNCCCLPACLPVLPNDKWPRRPPFSAIHNICSNAQRLHKCISISIYLGLGPGQVSPDSRINHVAIMLWQQFFHSIHLHTHIHYEAPLAISSKGYLRHRRIATQWETQLNHCVRNYAMPLQPVYLCI